MSCERALCGVVTEFLLRTCQRFLPSRNRHALLGAVCCGVIATAWQDDEVEVAYIPLTAGSVAEFYIEPLLPHAGDVDVMYHRNNWLAIPGGRLPPTQLPAEFHNYVKVFEITDSHLPGYVYLELRYLLSQCSDDDNYNAVECNSGLYATNAFPGCEADSGVYLSRGANIHGPASVCHLGSGMVVVSVDQVHCVRCLSWPSQAADWPTRHRNYGWPDSATLDCVVSNACDVVGVAHRQCRRHKWMGKYQWRLSFSRAEIVLINSWIRKQQVVYHMLRYFVKTERITDCAYNSKACTLSNYHMKTLMLWACELKLKSWWTDDVNLVRICVHLLHLFADWLSDRRCQHYFINNCNLLDSSFGVTNITDQLMSIDETRLSVWFVDNYIQKCLPADDCQGNISRLFDDVTGSTKLQNAVSALVRSRENRLLFEVWKAFNTAEHAVLSLVYKYPLTARSCVCWMTQMTKIDSHISVYFTAVAFLHVASRLQRHGFNEQLMDVLATLCGLHFTDIRRNFYHSTSVKSLNIAVKLMKVVANKSLSTMSLIEIELSKAYLYKALRCKDSDSDSIYCLANVYLAVLFYTTEEYQTAIDHCTLVTRSQDHSQCSSRVLQCEILPKIDDDVYIMLGLAELYQSVRTAALKHRREPQLLSVFTLKLFAYYLLIKYQYMPITESRQIVQTSDLRKLYGSCVIDTPQLFIGDVLLFLSVSRLLEFQHKPICPKSQHTLLNANKDNTSNFVKLLQKSAVEHLTIYRQLVARDCGSVATIATTDFEALFAYKRGVYQQCFQLSTQNVHALLYADFIPVIPIFPEFIQLMDDNIVSLTALTLIVNPKWREWRDFTIMPYITQLTLSLYLMTQCQLKLHHSVTSLAQTLNYIEVTQGKSPADESLEHLTLKLLQRIAVSYIHRLLSNV